VSAKANSNDEFQYANHTVDAASSDLRLSALRYTLLFEWLRIQKSAKNPGEKSIGHFHPLIKPTYFSYRTRIDKRTPIAP